MGLSFAMMGGGLVLLLGGGEALVRAAVALAQALRVPLLVISVSFVAIGTSIPELAVAVQAVQQGHAELALGNVIGSNVANVLLVLGAVALIRPLPMQAPGAARDVGVMLAASLVLLALLWWGEMTRVVAVLMLLGGAVYLASMFVGAADPPASDELQGLRLPGGLPVAGAALLVGLGGVLLGTHWLLEGATALARTAGLSEAVIGLSLIALGTSLPELAIGILAARRGQAALTLGNVLGSNISNIVWILGLAALFVPFSFAPVFWRDGWLMLAVAAAAGWWVLGGRTLTRLQGAVCLALYAVWVILIYQ